MVQSFFEKEKKLATWIQLQRLFYKTIPKLGAAI